MSMLIVKNEKLSEAIKKLRDLYPDDSLGDAIIMVVDRLKKAEKKCYELAKDCLEAKQNAYEKDKRYCDILVEKRGLEVENKQYKTIVDAHIEKAEELEKENKALKKALYAVYGTDEEATFVDISKLENSLKGKVNPTYMGYPVDPENPENCKVNLEELEK